VSTLGQSRSRPNLTNTTPPLTQPNFLHRHVSSIILPCAIISKYAKCSAFTKYFAFRSAGVPAVATPTTASAATATATTGYNTNHASPTRTPFGDSISNHPFTKAQNSSKHGNSSIRSSSTSPSYHAAHPTPCAHPSPSSAPIWPCHPSPRLSVPAWRVSGWPPAAPCTGPSVSYRTWSRAALPNSGLQWLPYVCGDNSHA
jgi:hypothetical protein